jgi:hypothetical protein
MTTRVWAGDDGEMLDGDDGAQLASNDSMRGVVMKLRACVW